MGDVRKAHPRAYEPRTEDDDKKLIAECQSGRTTEELMELFGRQRGGIRSRLGKLGLLSHPSRVLHSAPAHQVDA
ncbi:MAG: hypothetical protein ACXQTR_01990, partial [Candidatus Methanospirareceae archaeon]